MGKIRDDEENCLYELNHFQNDALNELCNIASSHAVTALAEMTGMTFDIDVPSLNVVPIRDVKYEIGAEEIVAGVLIRFEGRFSGHVYIIFPERSAFHLVDLLLSRMPGETRSIESGMEESALMETGNILASAFCDAVADFLHFTLVPSIPSFAFDMVGAMIESALIDAVQAHETEHAILFKCAFHVEERRFFGYLLFFPHPDPLKVVLSMLERKLFEVR
jgi:chemotaxis protein CheC